MNGDKQYILWDVVAEMDRQDRKWGSQRTNPTTVAKWAKQAVIGEELAKVHVDWASTMGDGVSWSEILVEEIAEAFNAPPESLREELVQCAAVIVQWINYLDAEEAES